MTSARADSRRGCPFRCSTRRSGATLGAIACALAAAMGGPASAESWEFTFSRQTLTPEQPSTTVTLWAKFAPTDWAFAEGVLDVRSSEAGWSDLSTLLPLPAQGAGVLEPGGIVVRGISAHQTRTTFTVPPDPSNPLAIWQATFTVTDFAPRDIALSTQTSWYRVFSEVTSAFTEPRTPIEIEAAIRVIPAPTPLVLLGLGALAAGRRRRRSTP